MAKGSSEEGRHGEGGKEESSDKWSLWPAYWYDATLEEDSEVHRG